MALVWQLYKTASYCHYYYYYYYYYCFMSIRGWWRWALVSLDGVVPSRMVGVSASVNLPLHHEVQKFSFGTGSPGWSRKNGHKTVVVWWSYMTTCVSRQAQFITGGFCCSKVLLPACPCWRQASSTFGLGRRCWSSHRCYLHHLHTISILLLAATKLPHRLWWLIAACLSAGVWPAQCATAGAGRSLLHQDENADDPQVCVSHDPCWTSVQQSLAGDCTFSPDAAVHNVLDVDLLDSWHIYNSTCSIRSPVVDAEKMRLYMSKWMWAFPSGFRKLWALWKFLPLCCTMPKIVGQAEQLF